MFTRFLLLSFLILAFSPAPGHAQFDKLKRSKIFKKAKEILNDEADDAVEEAIGVEEAEESDPSRSQRKGKKLSPPKVNDHLSNAYASLDAREYSAIRYEIRQALLGVELELGQQVLDHLPTTVSGLQWEQDQDQLYSQGIGFVGLAIGRSYDDGDRELEASILNNSALYSMYNGYLTNANYGSAEGEYKQVNIQGQRGALTFDGNNGYELGIPLGQESLFLLKCTNFPDEEAVTQAALEFDLEGIMEILGEQ